MVLAVFSSQGTDAKLTAPLGDMHLNISLQALPLASRAVMATTNEGHFMNCLRGWRKATTGTVPAPDIFCAVTTAWFQT
jgi:hypothetical protein